jgi:siroheme synthase/uroporphyrinogen-III synthase
MRASSGKIYFIGLGSAEPGLLAPRAQELIERADLIVYGADVERNWPRLLQGGGEKLFTGRKGRDLPKSSEEIVDAIRVACRKGQLVVRLSPGDAFFSSMIQSEIMMCHAQGITFEVLPAVPTCFAASVFAGIPLLQRTVANSLLIIYTPGLISSETLGAAPVRSDPIPRQVSKEPRRPGIRVTRQSLTQPTKEVRLPEFKISVPLPPMAPPPRTPVPVRSGQGNSIDWQSISRTADTLVFLNAGDFIPRVCAGLMQSGRPRSEPIAAISEAGTPHQKVILTNLGDAVSDLGRTRLPDDAMLIVGDTINLREALDFRCYKTLQGMRVGLLEGPDVLGRETKILDARGCRVRHFPIAVSQPQVALDELLTGVLDEIRLAHYIVVIDEQSATNFLDGLRQAGLDIRVLPEYCQVIAANATVAARLAACGLLVKTSADTTDDAILSALPVNLVDRRVLLVEPSMSRVDLYRELRLRGAVITPLVVYERTVSTTELESLADALEGGDLDFLVIHSLETAKILVERWGGEKLVDRLEGTLAGCCDPAATEYLTNMQVSLAIVQKEFARLIDQLESKGQHDVGSVAKPSSITVDEDW